MHIHNLLIKSICI